MNSQIEIIKPIELYKLYGIKDFIVTRENGICKMIDEVKLVPINEYYDENKNYIKNKYFLNHYGMKENMYISFYENGVIKSIFHYHNNILNGKFRNFYECGGLKDEGYYLNNKIHIFHSIFYEPTIGRNKLMTYIEYNNGEIMGRYSTYRVNGKLYKERYIYQNMIFHDIDEPVIYIDECICNNEEVIVRIITENNKIVISNTYKIIKYNNDINQYYLFIHHLGFPHIEKFKEYQDYQKNILFSFYYDRSKFKLIVTANESKINTFNKILF